MNNRLLAKIQSMSRADSHPQLANLQKSLAEIILSKEDCSSVIQAWVEVVKFTRKQNLPVVTIADFVYAILVAIERGFYKVGGPTFYSFTKESDLKITTDAPGEEFVLTPEEEFVFPTTLLYAKDTEKLEDAILIWVERYKVKNLCSVYGVTIEAPSNLQLLLAFDYVESAELSLIEIGGELKPVITFEEKPNLILSF